MSSAPHNRVATFAHFNTYRISANIFDLTKISVCANQLRTHGKCTSHPLASSPTLPMGPVPSFVDFMTGFPLIDPLEPLFSHIALKVSNFVLK
jgi:hypothetical protein